MSTNLTKLASDAALARLRQQRSELHAQVGMPQRLSPRWWQARGLWAVGEGGVPLNVYSQLSPSGDRVSVATHHPIGTLGGRLQIDIFDVWRLERVSSFAIDCARKIENDEERPCIRALRWLDDEHMVLGSDDGWLRICDLRGKLFGEARIGAHVEGIARRDGKLAVGLFGDLTPGAVPDLRAVGIKFFSVDALLAGCFEAELFLPSKDLGGPWPHTLRLDPNGNVMWTLGTRIEHSDRSTTVWIVRVDLPRGRGHAHLITPRTKERHEISEVSEDGELVVCTDDEAHLVDRRGQVLARVRTGHASRPKMRRLGGRRYVMAARGLWSLDFATQQLRPLGPDLGRVSDAWPLADGSVLAIVRCGALCELARLDPGTGEVVAHSRRGPVRHIDSHAFAYDYARRLHVGDYRGELHRFDDRLHSLSSLAPAVGSVQQVVSDPTRKRVGIVGASGAVRWAEGDRVTTHVLHDGTIVDPRNDYESVEITPEDEVFLSSACCPGWRAWLGGGRYWKFNARGKVRCLRRVEGPPGDSGHALDRMAEFQLPHKQFSRACGLAGHPVTVRSDGTLVVYEPTPPAGAAERAGQLPILVPKGTREIAGGFGEPRGIIATGAHEVLAWSTDKLSRLQFDTALTRVVAQRSADSARIGAVCVNPRSGGFVSSHGSHLAFWGPELDERYRLALLEDGSALWHVLHPRERAHPGWLWRDGGFAPWVASLFESRDACDVVVTNRALHEVFVADRFSESRVELALQDYDAFVRDLPDSRAVCAGDRFSLLLRERNDC